MYGTPDQIPQVASYEWVQQLPKNKKIYLALWQGWDAKDLPTGYDIYIVSFHLEAVNIPWLIEQTKRVESQIIVLFDGNTYEFDIPGVEFVPFYYWHEQLRKIISWHGINPRVMPAHKFSSVCNRISQNKLWITTKLLESAADDSLVILSDWLEPKNVHHWDLTGDPVLDNLSTIFRKKYLGQSIKIDNFDTTVDNCQTITSNPWQSVITDSAVYFSNESFHYSYYNNNGNEYIHPGPFLTEKTMKCLIGSSTLVPVGQFDTYRTLTQFGLIFNYTFDTSWDTDPGNISRMRSIVNLIDHLLTVDIASIELGNQAVNQYNQHFIVSGKFWKAVDQYNQNSVSRLFELING
jgi:hypothetical protein